MGTLSKQNSSFTMDRKTDIVNSFISALLWSILRTSIDQKTRIKELLFVTKPTGSSSENKVDSYWQPEVLSVCHCESHWYNRIFMILVTSSYIEIKHHNLSAEHHHIIRVMVIFCLHLKSLFCSNIFLLLLMGQNPEILHSHAKY